MELIQELESLLQTNDTLLISLPSYLFGSDQPVAAPQPARRRYDEYLDLLRQRFRKVYLLKQPVYPVSYVRQLNEASTPAAPAADGPSPEGPVVTEKKDVFYLLALCSNRDLEAPGALLLDVQDPAAQERLDEFVRPGPAPAAPAANGAQTAAPTDAPSGAVDWPLPGQPAAPAPEGIPPAAPTPPPSPTNDLPEGKELAGLRLRLQKLTAEKNASQSELAALRQSAEALKSRLAFLTSREQEFRDLLLDGRDRLLLHEDKVLQRVGAELKAFQDYAADLEDRVRDLGARNAAAQNQMADLNEQLRAMVAEKDELHANFSQLEKDSREAAEERKAVQEEVDKLEGLVQERAAQRDGLQEELNRVAEDREARQARLQELEAYIGELEERVQQGTSVADRLQELDTYIRELEERVQQGAPLQQRVHALEHQLGAAAGELSRFEQVVQELTAQRDALQREVLEAGQARVQELSARVDFLSQRETELREMLLDAHDQLLCRDEEIQAYLATVLKDLPAPMAGALRHTNGAAGTARPGASPASPAGPVITGPIASPRASGRPTEVPPGHLVHAIRKVVGRVLPPGAKVAVVNDGDTALLHLDGRPTWPFPPAGSGKTPGAVPELEALRAQGADFLLIPSTAQGWLEQQPALRQHLDSQCVGLVCHEAPCTIFDLHAKPSTEEQEQRRRWLEQVRDMVRRRLPPQAAVAVVSEGDAELLQLDGRRTWHFPQTDSGDYAGYPADSATAIANLEWLRAAGAQYLLVPTPALWWLDHFAGLRQYLEQHGVEVVCQEESCAILDLQHMPAVVPPPRPEALPTAKLERMVQQLLPAPAVGGLKHYYWDMLEYLERSVGLVVRREGAQVVLDLPPTMKEHQLYRLLAPQVRKVMDRLPDPALAGLKIGYQGVKHLLERYLGVVVRPRQEEFFPEEPDEDLVAQIRRVVARVLPPWARVAVLSEGHPELLHLADRQACHFPPTPDGAYAGKPTDSDAAITQLEALRVQGVDFLVVPRSTRGWLETYPEFHHFLDSQCIGIVCQESPCWIYDLHDRPTPEDLQKRQQLIGRIRDAAQRRLPPGATVLVVNEGDLDLLRLEGLTAWPFPRTADGGYAGYPADEAAAIANLEALRGQGAEYLLFPNMTFWMLQHYAGFGRYLSQQCAGMMHEDETCVIFDLRQPGTPAPLAAEQVARLCDLVNRRLPPTARVVVYNQGRAELLQQDGRPTWPFPRTRTGAAFGEPGAAALTAELEELRAQGAEFLLVPAPALPELMRSPELVRYLLEHYPEVVHDEETGRILSLVQASDADRQLSRQLVQLTAALVNERVPAGAVVAVISEGNEDFLQLGERTAWHFPRQEDGTHAGFFTSNEEAIEHLEALRANGLEYLIVPPSSFWWLIHYGELRLHLERHYRLVAHQPLAPGQEVCNIYALVPFRKRETTVRAFGVNIAGNLNSEKGVGEAIRSVIRGLETVQVPYVLNNFVDCSSLNPDTTFSQFAPDNPYRFNIIQANADAVPGFVIQKGETYLHDHYNIGYWFWELSQFPKEWEASLQYFDELWAGSSFILDALARIAPVPVIRIPVSIVEQLPTLPLNRAHFGLPPEAFVFLFVFDFHSIMERKHPLGLIQVFRKAFSRQDNALLVLKGSHAGPGEVEVLQAAAGDANVRVMDSVMSREEVNTLIQLSDCYVSLHRSEGFGLTLLEAMSLEKPVIATSYSGNMDFMTPANSYLVKYALKEIAKDYGPYRKGWVWADPDLDHAAELMRSVFDNPAAAREVGRKARQDVLRQLHPAVVGKLMKDRLLKVAKP